MSNRGPMWRTTLATSVLHVAVLACGCGRLGYARTPEDQGDAGPDAARVNDAGTDAPVAVDARALDAQVLDVLVLDAYAPDAAPECMDALACDDGDACTVDACAMGSCVHTARDCGDGHSCTMDVCSPAVGCMHPPDPGAPCAAGRRCDPTGTGRDGSPPDPAGCVLAAECMVDLECEDGAFCTTDTCESGVCASVAVSCVDDGSACTATAFCDESADACADPFDATSLTDPAHCGTSAATCVAPCVASRPNTEASCVAGACGSRCLPDFHDLDGNAVNGCEYACTILSAASDPPDGIDGNCDGADGVVGATIYASAGGTPTGTGLSPDAPVSLERALAVAAMAGLPRLVLVAAGAYPTSSALVAPPGLALFGGYAPDFRSRGAVRTAVQSSADTALVVDGAMAELDGIDLTTADRTIAGASTRTLVVRSSPALILRDVRVAAGRGGPGVDGARGSDGAGGLPGAPSSGQEPGGVWREVGSGGRAPTTFMGPVGEGSAGASIGGCVAPGGGYATHIGTGNCSLCDPTTINLGEPGSAGCPGADGAPGAGGSSGAGTISVMGDWSPFPGATGASGSAGDPGGIGGGGGAGGVYACNVVTAAGTGGGQGGGGGSPGSGGRGGSPGGGSFAIVAVSSTLTLTGVTLTTVGGGAGGPGGDGGAGGPGGPGGGADTPIEQDAMCMPMRTVVGGLGGTGGAGGRGGRGGCGGGGAGGPTAGIIAGPGLAITPGATISSTIGAGGAGGAACPGGGGLPGAVGARAEML